MKYSGGGMDFPCMEHLHKLIFVVFVWAVPPGGGVYSREFWIGVFREGSWTLTLFKD